MALSEKRYMAHDFGGHMKNHYLEQFIREIKKYAQVTDINLSNAEAANLEGTTQRRADLKLAEAMAIDAIEKLKKKRVL